MQALRLAFVIAAALSTACPRSSDEPVVVPVQVDAEAQPEAPAEVDRIARVEIGPGIATVTEAGVVKFDGPSEYQTWLAEQGTIEDIWLGTGVCVRTAEGTSCKGPQSEFRVEPPVTADVIDVAWSGPLCAVTDDGVLWCRFGAKPLRRFPLSGVREIDVRAKHGCARLEDGSAQCWLNQRRLGDFCKTERVEPGCLGLQADEVTSPAPDVGFPGIIDIAAGSMFACVLGEDGVPRCHDDGMPDSIGLVGRDFEAIEGMPTLVEIEGGERHVCGRSRTGEIWCWGSNEYGQIGDGTTKSAKVRAPTRVEGISGAEALASNEHQTCAVAQGEVWCWGWWPDTPIDPIPTEVPGVVASELLFEPFSRTCARTATAWKCWGGKIETAGGAVAASTVVDAGSEVEEFADGCRFDSGRLRCDDGEVWLDRRGVIDVSGRSSPCALLHERVECRSRSGSKEVIRVPASTTLQNAGFNGCVLTEKGTVHCWGYDSPAKPIDLPGKQVAISVGSEGACALDDSRNARCWPHSQVQAPAVIGMTDIVELHGGLVYGCARDGAGEIACWGTDAIADLQAPSTKVQTPVKLQLPAPAVEFGVDDDYGCARLDDGRVFCWGDETMGQRGRLSSEFIPLPRKRPAA